MTTKKKFIEQAWQSFLANVVPKDASQAQIDDTRNAFFGGASILFTLIIGGLDEGSEETEADLNLFSAIQDEITEYGQLLDLKYLKTQEH